MSATADVQTAAAAPPPPPMAPDGASGEPIPADVSAGGAGGAAEPALDAETLALARRMDAALRRAAMPEGAEGDAGSYVGWDSDDREYSSIFEMLERFAAARAALSDGAAAAAAAAAATDSGGKTHAPADAQGADGAGESDHQGRADGAGDRGDAAGSSLAWYSDAAAYWDSEAKCPPTVGGVLGGFPETHEPDIRESLAFIVNVCGARPALKRGRALDCGAGIGRITEALLSRVFDVTDLVEQSPRLIGAAKRKLRDKTAAGKVEHFACCGLQDWKPPHGLQYDCVWIQWVAGHLLDKDFVDFLRRARACLSPGGVVVVKENTTESDAFWIDLADSSFVRSEPYFRAVFAEAGFSVLRRARQRVWPPDLFPLWMCCLVAE